MTALFAAGAGRATVGLNTNVPNKRVWGVYNPNVADTNFLGARYGLSRRTQPSADHPTGEETTNGPTVGPEGDSIETLQDAIGWGVFSGSPWFVPVTAVAKAIDVQDAKYLEDPRNLGYCLFASVQQAERAHVPVTPPPPPPPHPPAPPVTPTVPPSTPPVTLRALSPASVRVEELRVYGCVILGTVKALQGGSPFYNAIRRLPQGENESWLSLKPFAVEILRFYRRMRAIKYDTREIPQEDR